MPPEVTGRMPERVPPERVRQFPPMAKHPAARLMPPVVEKVEVAREKLMPPVFPIENKELGLVVPNPNHPFCVRMRSVLVDEPTANDDCPKPKEEVSTEKRAKGVVEAIPTEVVAVLPEPSATPKMVRRGLPFMEAV